MYCALFCKFGNPPSDIDIINQSIKVGPLVQQYKTYFQTARSEEVYFNGLVRGQSYTLRCLFQTTEADEALRKFVNYTVKSQLL